MKKLFLCAAIVLFVAGLTIGAGQKVGEIGNIDTGKKEVTVNIKSGAAVKMGDLLEVLVDNKSVILEVKYPMQTVAICKIKGKGKLSDLMNGLAVYRYAKGTANKGPKPGVTKRIGNMEFVYVEEGTFKMGSDYAPPERPVHEVTVDGFWMGKFEVTQKQYQEIMDVNPSSIKKEDLPVENVNWKDSMEFCKSFSEKYNVSARLPREAEWEYACRAGTSTRYYWGDKMDNSFCWNRDNSGGTTHSAGIKKPNAFGLYDMIGNVNEWCLDWFVEDFYAVSPKENPECQKGSSGLKIRWGQRIARGGSYFSYSDFIMRSASRGKYDPDLPQMDLGFRVVVVE